MKYLYRMVLAVAVLLVLFGGDIGTAHTRTASAQAAAAQTSNAQADAESDIGLPSEIVIEDGAIADRLPDQLRPTDFDVKDITTANTMISSLNVADWLGPLAPVALSPFFGLACLSGLSIWGPDWIANNALLSAAGPLKSEIVFGAFLLLTLLTSLPRLSKVSKPFAQAMDQVETYSVIVILLVVKFFAESAAPEAESQVAMIQMGVFSFTAQTLLAIAMVINLFVINSVKFFFEILIWLTPIPAIDAIFELCNKAVCAALMSLYAFSPTVATAVNLAVLVAALFVFRWAYRRMTFYRSIMVDLVLSRIWKSYGSPNAAAFVAFPKANEEPFVAKSRWKLTCSDGAVTATQTGLMGSQTETIKAVGRPSLTQGWIMHSLTIQSEEGRQYAFHVSRRFDGDLAKWAQVAGIDVQESPSEFGKDVATARAEFA